MGLDYETVGDQIWIKLSQTMEALPIVEKVKEGLYGFEVLAGTMDDAFISITGKEIRD